MLVTNNVMVCVTQQKTCERLIKKGEVLRNIIDGKLYIIHVAKDGVNFLGNKKESEALEYLFIKSKEFGAELTVLRSKDVTSTIVEFAENKNIGHIILGEPPKTSNEDSIVTDVKRKLSHCQFYIVPTDEK